MHTSGIQVFHLSHHLIRWVQTRSVYFISCGKHNSPGTTGRFIHNEIPFLRQCAGTCIGNSGYQFCNRRGCKILAFSPRTYFHKYLAQQIPIPVLVHIELYLPLQLQECFDELTAFFRAVITEHRR